MKNKELALSLLQADSEAEVIQLLQSAGYWHDATAWRLLGDKDSNYSTIGNQQARPEAALVEKVVNSVDARLLNECLILGIDPESAEAPHSIPHAISVLLDKRDHSTDHEGSIAEWGAPKVLDEARRITLSVTGNMPREGMPSITISDEGEGQTPGRFPDTFLSIDKSNKLRIQFVQGKFNMGGTGVLKFCGTHSLQLIISKRNPTIVEKWKGSGAKWESQDARADEWGFTVVRRERPTGNAGDVRNSVFRYLAPILSNGVQSVLSFKSDAFPIFPVGNSAYAREASYGSAIKLYEYDCKGFGSHALLPDGLLSRLEALLPQIALPVRLHVSFPVKQTLQK